MTWASRLALLAAVAVCGGCREARAPAAGSLGDDLLRLSRLAAPRAGVRLPDPERTLGEIDLVVRRVRELSRGPAGLGPVDALNRVVFDDLGFAREVEQEDVRALLLPTVLAGRKGSCVGLAQVYLVVAEQLGLPLHGVLAPGHLFVRFTGEGGSTNVELLRRGEAMPDAWYRERFRVPDGVAAYLRPLTGREVLGVVHHNLGNHFRRARDLERALEHTAAAVGLFADFAEAHASRGLTLQLAGNLAAAAQSYGDARRLVPGLPGLEQNVRALEAEQLAREVK